MLPSIMQTIKKQELMSYDICIYFLKRLKFKDFRLIK